MEKKRESNFELLRIFLILMIIVLHYCNGSMGGVLCNVQQGTVNYYITYFIESACIIAVNVFILITGYYMNSKNEIKISKVCKLIYLCAVYGIIIFVISLISGKIQLNKVTIKIAIDTIFNRWFVVIYSILYLLIPYINKIINNISQKQLGILIIILLLFFSIWPTFYTNIPVRDSGYGIINFVTLYLIGAYIKLYCDEIKFFKFSIFIYLWTTVMTTIISMNSGNAFAYNSIFNIVGAIAFFEIFKSLKIKNNKLINKLATFTFSTYIIHENQFIVKELYTKLFRCDEYYQSNYFIINLIISTIGIYIICVIIEWCRRKLMEKLIDSKIDNIKLKIEA